MNPVDDFAVRLTAPGGGDSEPTCRLFYRGDDTGVRLPGAVLEAALQAGTGWLLFLTHDIPFEESLAIVLLGANFELLDRATLAAPYAAGIFSGLQVLSDRTLQFQFLGEGNWQLELLENPGFRLPLMSEPPGVARPFGFSRRFVLSRLAEPTT